jgi:hypothetical protein
MNGFTLGFEGFSPADEGLSAGTDVHRQRLPVLPRIGGVGGQ